MLTRLSAVGLAVATLLVATATAAEAAPPVNCSPGSPVCVVKVEDPGAPGGGGQQPSDPGGAGASNCYWPDGSKIPCYDTAFGWWSNTDKCYYQLAAPQPPKSDPVWSGHSDGAIYTATCPASGGTGGGPLWIADPPPGFGGGGMTPARLADVALARLRLGPAVVGMAPYPGKVGVVGAPIWMWTEDRAHTWGPLSATASVPGLSVTAIARAVAMDWDMGDGRTVHCDSPGAPYRTAYGYRASPDCGHVYARSSADQPGHAYTVTVTTTWRITWSGGGQSGVLAQTRSTSLPVQIGELQVLVT